MYTFGKAQGSIPRLSFSPTEAPGTDIMQLLLQAQKKGRLEASYRRYRGTWTSSEGISRCSRGARRSRALWGDGHERHYGGTSPSVPYGLSRGGVVGRVLPQPLWSWIDSRLRGRTPARRLLYSLRPRALIHPVTEKACSRKLRGAESINREETELVPQLFPTTSSGGGGSRTRVRERAIREIVRASLPV